MQDLEAIVKRMADALEALEKNSAEGISKTDLKQLIERNRLLEETLTDTIAVMGDYIQSVNEILEMNKSQKTEEATPNEDTLDMIPKKMAVGE